MWKPVLVVALLASACRGSGPPAPLEGPPPRHVFLIVVDTLRADHLGFNGYARDTSPFLDGLAPDGAVFEQAYSASSNTLESVFAILASASPISGDLYREGVPAGLVSIQRAFADAGFDTTAVIGNPWLKVHEGFFADGFARTTFVNQERGETWGVNTTEETTDTVLSLLDGPFDPAARSFFYVHYLDPHDIYASPQDYGFYRGQPPEPRPLAHVLSGEGEIHARLEADPEFTGRPTPAPRAAEFVEFLEAAYDTEIHHVDRHLGRIFEKLEQLGALDESLILITADHGEEFLEHGLLKHGFQLYEETVRVPWLLYGPAFVRAGRDTRPIGGVDTAPTLLDLAGIPVPPTMLGRNVLADAESPPVFFSSHFLNQDLRGMRAGSYKLIEDRRTGAREFFDLRADPQEKQALDPATHEAWPAFTAVYERMMALYGAGSVGDERLAAPVIDEETREQLRSLGYVN